MTIRYIKHGAWKHTPLWCFNIMAFASLPVGLLYVLMGDNLRDVITDWLDAIFCKYERENKQNLGE